MNRFNRLNKIGMVKPEFLKTLETMKKNSVPEKVVSKAFQFLFPGESENSSLYFDFRSFVEREYNELGCVVLYERSQKFKSFLDSHHLAVNKKEVIIPENFALRATKNYGIPPRTL